MTRLSESSHFLLVLFVASLASISLSFWMLNGAIVNPDGICYLHAAALYTKSGLHDAMHLCGQARWPFYSVMIAWTTQFLSISYETSAYFLDAIFSLITVLTYLVIIKRLGASTRVMYFAALVILCAPVFNSTREYIVRDHGYWAGYLISMLALLTYFQTKQKRYAWLCSVSLIVASLFRIEGAVFLLLIPFTALFEMSVPFTKRFASYIQLNLLNIIIMMTLLAWFLLHPNSSLNQLSRLNELFQQFYQAIDLMQSEWISLRDGLKLHVLPTEAIRDANAAVFFILSGLYIASLINNLSLLYAGLFIYGWWVVTTFTPSMRRVLYAYLIVNMLITISFMMQHVFLSKRYLLALTLILLCWIPFALDALYSQLKLTSRRASVVFMVILLIVNGVPGLFASHQDKQYIKEAGLWMKSHLSPTDSVFSNDLQVLYYADYHNLNLLPDYETMHAPSKTKSQSYDVMVMQSSHRDKTQYTQFYQAPIQVFRNRLGDQVSIYSAPH